MSSWVACTVRGIPDGKLLAACREAPAYPWFCQVYAVVHCTVESAVILAASPCWLSVLEVLMYLRCVLFSVTDCFPYCLTTSVLILIFFIISSHVVVGTAKNRWDQVYFRFLKHSKEDDRCVWHDIHVLFYPVFQGLAILPFKISCKALLDNEIRLQAIAHQFPLPFANCLLLLSYVASSSIS